MNRIEGAFGKGKQFVGFVTAGDPCLEKTEEYVRTMVAAGAGIVEIGIPFSDPTAEGPVIVRAHERALGVHTTTKGIFEMVESLRKDVRIQLLFMTYLNPVYSSGY